MSKPTSVEEIVERLFWGGMGTCKASHDPMNSGGLRALEDKLKEEAAAKINRLIVDEREELLDYIKRNLPGETDCAEFYVGNAEGCKSKEHARRTARFFYAMEVEDMLEELSTPPVKELGDSNG